MKAYLLNEAGGVENLVFSEVEQPEVGSEEVLIEVQAISINPVDIKVRPAEEFITMILATEERPVILGWDIAGVVTSVGDDVVDFSMGDRVFGMVNFPGQGKAYAEYVAAPASQLARMPDAMSFEEGAATTLAALTALQILKSRISSGDRVLIHAGSGGVGHFAIQIAKRLGAYVISTSSSANREFIMSLGADEHIDYREQDFSEVLSDVDFVLDALGGGVLENSLKVVKDGGCIVSLPTMEFSEALQASADSRQVKLEFILVQSNGDDMRELAAMVEAGALKAHVSKSFPFEKLADAHLQIESARTVGKAVVVI